jgi:hypothetical protein
MNDQDLHPVLFGEQRRYHLTRVGAKELSTEWPKPFAP